MAALAVGILSLQDHERRCREENRRIGIMPKEEYEEYQRQKRELMKKDAP